MPRASVHTFGCRLNQADSALLAADLAAHGFELVPWGEEADLLVVNSCAVTATAVQKARQAVRQARRRAPEAYVVFCGCAASELTAADAALAAEIDLALPNPKPPSLAALLPAELRHGGGAALPGRASSQAAGFRLPGRGVYPEHTRANLKVQEGCDFHCTYCIVPQVRGAARSRDYADTLREARELLAAGYRELVLTGVNIATYRDSGRDLAGLLAGLLELPGDFRLRLGSTEPGPVLPKIIDLMRADPRLCRFLHLPLQYGEDGILRRMHRHYTCAQYAALVERAAAELPGVCLGTDVMVGFPGEDDAAFDACRAYLERLPFGLMHVFCYSPRPETPAAEWPRPEARVAQSRESELLALAARKAAAFAEAQVGARVRVLLEQDAPAPQGWSDNYLKVRLPKGSRGVANTFRDCRITAVLDAGERLVAGEPNKEEPR